MATLRAGDFRAGEPVELALKCTTARYVAGMYGPQSMFTTSRGKLYLDPEPASDIETQVRDLAIAPGETIRVMRMRKPDGGYGWEVRRIVATLEEQPLESLEAREGNREAAGGETETACPVTETKAAEIIASASNGTSANGTSAKVNGNHVTASQDDSQQHSGNPPPVIPAGTLKLMACFKQAIDAVAEAQVYSRRTGLGITFTSEDVRATAISCYINCTREGR